MILTRIAAPPPLSVAAFRDAARIDHSSEDALLAVYLAAAVAELDGPDGVLGRCIAPQTWRMQLAGWSDPIVLPVEPVRSIAVVYDDPAGDEQVLAAQDYALETGVGIRPRLRWAVTARPALAAMPWPVRITIEAGPASVPSDLLTAVWMRAADLYEHREASGPQRHVNPAWSALIARHRLYL